MNDELQQERVLDLSFLSRRSGRIPPREIAIPGVPLDIFYGAFRAINGVKDEEDAMSLAAFIAFIATNGQMVEDDHVRLAATVLWLRGHTDEEWKTEADALLSFSYHLLRSKRINRKEAAEFAAFKLRLPIDQDMWRKRVDRWAKARKYPPVGQTKRRPRK